MRSAKWPGDDYLVDTEGCLKSGFVLPREIQESEIVCDASEDEKLDIDIAMKL